MRLLRGIKDKVIKDDNNGNVLHTEIVLVNCNIVNNDYQQDSKVLCIFVCNELFGQLLDIWPKKYILKDI